jgi:hypothetical protein
MKDIKFVADKSYKSNFSVSINDTLITVVVPSGTEFTKGESITLSPVKRKTGEGYYLIRKLEVAEVILEVVESTEIKTTNQLDLSIFGI